MKKYGIYIIIQNHPKKVKARGEKNQQKKKSQYKHSEGKQKKPKKGKLNGNERVK